MRRTFVLSLFYCLFLRMKLFIEYEKYKERLENNATPLNFEVNQFQFTQGLFVLVEDSVHLVVPLLLLVVQSAENIVESDVEKILERRFQIGNFAFDGFDMGLFFPLHSIVLNVLLNEFLFRGSQTRLCARQFPFELRDLQAHVYLHAFVLMRKARCDRLHVALQFFHVGLCGVHLFAIVVSNGKRPTGQFSPVGHLIFQRVYFMLALLQFRFRFTVLFAFLLALALPFSLLLRRHGCLSLESMKQMCQHKPSSENASCTCRTILQTTPIAMV